MRWEDWVITIGQVIFIIAIIPAIRGKDKPPVFTSVITGVVLLTFAAAQYSLGLISSVFTSIILGSSWIFLGYQKFIIDKKK